MISFKDFLLEASNDIEKQIEEYQKQIEDQQKINKKQKRKDTIQKIGIGAAGVGAFILGLTL